MRAVAEKGEANRAVETAVAAWLGVPKSSVARDGGRQVARQDAGDRRRAGQLAALVAARVAALQ